MSQASLFDYEGRVLAPAPKASEQTLQLCRVAAGIEFEVFEWVRARVGQSFHLRDLVEDITKAHDGYVAPDSPARMLRMLRQKGFIELSVQRSTSHYTVVRA